MKIEKGTILTAIDPCDMDEGGNPALIVGKQYEVTFVNNHWFEITSEEGGEGHAFHFNHLEEYFKEGKDYNIEVLLKQLLPYVTKEHTNLYPKSTVLNLENGVTITLSRELFEELKGE